MEQIAWRFRDLTPRHFEPETILLSEGGMDGRLYVLTEGAVAVVRAGVRVALVDHPGAVFGEMSVLRSVPHSASVKAVTDCQVYVIDDARDWLKDRPDVAFYVANLLAERLADTTALLVEAQSTDDRSGGGQAGLFSRMFGALSGTKQAGAPTPAPSAPRFMHE